MDKLGAKGFPIRSKAVLPTPQAVLFDWDQTLVRIPFSHLVKAADVPAHQPTLTSRVAAVVRRVPHSEITIRKALGLRPVPESLQTLRLLHAHGVPIAIVSNTSHTTLSYEVPHYLGELSQHVIYQGMDDATPRKPDPTGVLRVLGSLDIPPSPNVWMVGDRYSTDMVAALKAGVSAVLIHPSRSDQRKVMSQIATPGESVHMVEGHRALSLLLQQRLRDGTAPLR